MGARQRIRRLTPYLLLAPGILWLLVFYVYPSIQMFISSFWTGTLETGFTFSLANWTTYTEALDRYAPQFLRSLLYGAAATVICFVIAYPLAYAIAFKGGRWKNVLLFLVIAPFFTSFLLRTQSWKIILGDDGIVFGPLKDLGFLPPEFRVLATPAAVVAGIAYNFLPFMTLPIYVSLEKIDIRLVEAAKDLYAGPWRPGGTVAGAVIGGLVGAGMGASLSYAIVATALVGTLIGVVVGTFFVSESFTRVVFPLSLPGVFAGSLLTFIPAMGDFVNAELLGNTQTRMIGNVIQSRFLENNDYPTAAALSFILMAAILFLVAVYARVLGTDELTSAR
ncbi:MAG TPA: ABC transporter permease subunit [Candidatus Limnocylindrales bacterium]|nr:ABC transporter permease subunit [Candidatus Limnocylindrales bacterium]